LQNIRRIQIYKCFNNFLFGNMPYQAYLLNIKDKHFFGGTHENFIFSTRNQKVSDFSFCFVSLESRFGTILQQTKLTDHFITPG